ncbi:Protein P [Labeo rohita]|uniref:Protein P n=1 Tax=Labeo rohita TaxID=84645 RepID=A0ABQ8MSD8_LABRO|nr:Protein P [Labeo rohita]
MNSFQGGCISLQRENISLEHCMSPPVSPLDGAIAPHMSGQAESAALSSSTIRVGTLANHVIAWMSVSAPEWVILTITRGYRLQFAKRTPRFNGVISSHTEESSAHKTKSPPFSPRTFSLCAEAALAPLRTAGLRILTYLDDWSIQEILADSREKVMQSTARVLAHVTALGFRVNVSKSNFTPVQNVIFLGLELNSVTMRMRLTQECVLSFMNCLSQFREGARVQYRTCLRLQGLMASAVHVLPLGLLRMRAFMKWVLSLHFSPLHDLCRSVTVTRTCTAALRHWRNAECYTRGTSLGAIKLRKVVTTDASLTGWGATQEGRIVNGVWTSTLRGITCWCGATTPQLWHISTPRRDALLQASCSSSQAASMEQAALSVITGDPCPGHFEQGRRPFVKGEPTLRRMAPPSSDSGSAMGEVRSGCRRSLRLARKCPLSYVLLATGRQCPPWRGRTGPPNVLLYAFPLLCLISLTLARVKEQSLTLILIAPRWPKSPWLAEIVPLLYAQPWPLPLRTDLLSQADGEIHHPHPDRVALWAWPVYLAAIAACHVGFDGTTVGQHPLICRFMKGARRSLPVTRRAVPGWDLSLTALLLALASAKRVSDLHALSVHTSCTKFSHNGEKVFLRPNPAFMPKCFPAFTCEVLELSAFHPPPFSSEEDQRLNALCPVHALWVYIDRTSLFRRSDQLFISWALPNTGNPISKQRLSHWLVEAISLAYESKGVRPPEGLKAHSTRGMAASWALFKGVSLQDICAAASWASPHTFIRYYRLDVTQTPVAHSVLGVGSS